MFLGEPSFKGIVHQKFQFCHHLLSCHSKYREKNKIKKLYIYIYIYIYKTNQFWFQLTYIIFWAIQWKSMGTEMLVAPWKEENCHYLLTLMYFIIYIYIVLHSFNFQNKDLLQITFVFFTEEKTFKFGTKKISIFGWTIFTVYPKMKISIRSGWREKLQMNKLVQKVTFVWKDKHKKSLACLPACVSVLSFVCALWCIFHT